MKNGMSFNGVHSSTLAGVTARTRDRPVMPAPKMAAYEADNMSGDIDFTDYTGITYYQNRTVAVDFQIAGKSLGDLQNKINAVMMWCRGKGQIIFDDIPAVTWIGRVSDSVSYLPEHGGQSAVLSVSFLCEPFTRFLHDAFDGVKLGDKIPIGSMFKLGAPQHYTIGPSAFGMAQVIDILGDVPVMPILKKTTTGVWSVTIDNGLGTQTFRCTQTAKTTLDCVKKQIYGEDGTNYMPYMTGDFIMLTPGDNTIISTSQTFELHYTPLYLYNGGLS